MCVDCQCDNYGRYFFDLVADYLDRFAAGRYGGACFVVDTLPCSLGPTRGLVFDEPAVGSSDRCRSGVVLYIVKIVRKGEGAGFEPMTCSGGVLRFRASRQCCTEAMSEVSFNSSPRLFGS